MGCVDSRLFALADTTTSKPSIQEQVSEQASTMQSPAGLFNLDAMNPDGPSEPQVPDATVSTTTQSDISEASGFVTPAKQPNRQQVTGGGADHAPGSSQIPSPSKVTKLSVSATSGDDFFDSSWDGDQDDTDAAAERLREESRLQAERIMLEEERRQKHERERIEAERAENERLAAEKLKREQEAEAELLEQKRKEEVEAARIEAERLEQERIARELELKRQQEAATARLEAERLERERIEQERLAAEELKRQEEAEAARLEAERLAAQAAAEEVARQQEVEAARLEAERLEKERIEKQRVEAEQAAKAARLEEERLEQEQQLAIEEKARAEAERLDAERLEQERLAADELKRQQESETRRLERERSAESSRQQETERLERERLEEENQMEDSSREQGDEHGWDDGGIYEDEEDDLDGMYDDEGSEADIDDAGGVAVEHPRPNDSDQTPSAGDPDAGNMERGANANDGSDLPTTEPQPSEASFFDAAAAVTSASTSMQSMFESNAQGLFGTSTAATSMFSWGGGETVVEDSSGPVSDEATAVQSQHDEVSKRTKSQQHEVRNGDAATDPNEHQSDVSGGVPQHTLDNFVKQLERMTESHQLEMDELQRTHRIDMDRLQAELDDERETKKKDHARKEVASQDKFLKQVREMEKQCNAQLEEKENQLQEAMKRNEGMGLKLNTLKREVDGLAKIVDERYVPLVTLLFR